MDIKEGCSLYFNPIKDIKNGHIGRGIAKCLSYLLIPIPLIMGLTYVCASFASRFSKKPPNQKQSESVRSVSNNFLVNRSSSKSGSLSIELAKKLQNVIQENYDPIKFLDILQGCSKTQENNKEFIQKCKFLKSEISKSGKLTDKQNSNFRIIGNYLEQKGYHQQISRHGRMMGTYIKYEEAITALCDLLYPDEIPPVRIHGTSNSHPKFHTVMQFFPKLKNENKDYRQKREDNDLPNYLR